MQGRILLSLALAGSISMAVPAWSQSTSAPSPATTDIPEDRDTAAPMSKNVDIGDLSSSDLNNKPVYDTKSEQIATITSVTGTPGTDRQAILQTGGVLGIGGREVSLPLNKIGVNPDGRLVLQMTKDELKLLPKAH